MKESDIATTLVWISLAEKNIKLDISIKVQVKKQQKGKLLPTSPAQLEANIEVLKTNIAVYRVQLDFRFLMAK